MVVILTRYSATKLKPVIVPTQSHIKKNVDWQWPRYFKSVPFPIPGKTLTWPSKRPYGVGLSGGRASGKSYSVAQWLIRCLTDCPNSRALVLRQTGASLQHSFKAELENVIRDKQLEHHFEILHTTIRCRASDGLIMFKPLSDHTSENVKSVAKIDICILEEAQQMSTDSLNKLYATLREPNLFWMAIWNPKQDPDPILTKIQSLIDTPQSFYDEYGFEKPYIIHSTYIDNPFASGITKLTAQSVKIKDEELYSHEWLGLPLNIQRALIINNYEIVDGYDYSSFQGPFYGADFGSTDPTTLVGPVWVDDVNKIMYIQDARCANTGKNSVTDAYNIMCHVPFDQVIQGDNAMKSTITTLQEQQVPIVSCVKKQVSSSLFNLRQYKILIDKQCLQDRDYNIQVELDNYKWKKVGDKYIDTPIDTFNHFIDAFRYAVTPFI